jgi:FHS family L-fucose permease-like MFS transporter
VAAVLIALALVIARFKLPSFGEGSGRVAAEERKRMSLWRHRNLVHGVPGIFIYLIAEIGVSIQISEITLDHQKSPR